MKLKLLTIAFVSLLLCSTTVAQTGIQFEHTPWAEIVKKAKAEKKLIFLDAYASWCGPCKWMSKNTFPDEKVGEFFNANFICAKIDMEKGEGPDLKAKFGVPAYPTLLYISGDEIVMHRTVGGSDPAGLLEQGKIALDPNQRFETFDTKFKDGTLERKDIPKYIKLLETAYMPLDDILGKYFSSMTKEQILEKENWELIKKNVKNIDSDAFKIFEKYSSDLAAKYSQNAVDNQYFNAYFSHFETLIYREKASDEKIQEE